MDSSTKRKIWVWVVIILIVVNVSSLATIGYHRYEFRQKRKSEMRDTKGRTDRTEQRRGERRSFSTYYKESLNLTEEQSKQMDSVQQYYVQQRHELSKEMGQLRNELEQELSAAELDELHLQELSEQQAFLFNRMNESTIAMNIAVRSFLLPEQIPTYIEQLKKIEHRRGERRNPESRTRRTQ